MKLKSHLSICKTITLFLYLLCEIIRLLQGCGSGFNYLVDPEFDYGSRGKKG
jgi:hypothetical protein